MPKAAIRDWQRRYTQQLVKKHDLLTVVEETLLPLRKEKKKAIKQTRD